MVSRKAVGLVSSPAGTVEAVCRDGAHRFSKTPCPSITLQAGIGVVGDAHAGVKVQHLSRMRADPDQPNLRQVHLMHAELFEELAPFGYTLAAGDLGENITTSGIDLLGLGRDTLLRVGADAVLRITGLRNPCAQIERFAPGLLARVAVKTSTGIERKAGIMAVVVEGGTVSPGDAIAVSERPAIHIPLDRV